MAYKITKKEMVKEVVKCGKSPTYFIDNYAKIPHPLKGLIPFKTYDYQSDLLENFNDRTIFHRRTCINTCIICIVKS